MIKLINVLVVCASALWSIAAPASARVSFDCDPGITRLGLALVVGINAYKDVGHLQRAVADAEGVAAKFRGLGLCTALLAAPDRIITKQDFDDAWADFKADLRDGDVAAFFFAGHGFEVNASGKTYLMPSDISWPPQWTVLSAAAQSLGAQQRQRRSDMERHLDSRGILLQAKLAELDGLGKVLKLRLFIIDACRNDPMGSANGRGALMIGGPPRSMASVENETFLMYSAGPGQTAHDGVADAKNSIYTTELIKQIGDAKDLAHLAQDLRQAVYDVALKIQHVQRPAYADGLTVRRNILGLPFDKLTASDTDDRLAKARADLLLEQQSYVSLINSSGSLARSPESDDRRTPGAGFQDCRYCPAMVATPRATAKSLEDPNIPLIAFGRFEVTEAEYLFCVTNGGCTATYPDQRSLRSWTPDPLQPSSNGAPVLDPPALLVSWNDTQDYLKWLNAWLTRYNPGKTYRYRLPTAAEWEFAARGAGTGKYGFGDDPANLCSHANGADSSLFSFLYVNDKCVDRFPRGVAPAGSFAANGFGLHDMLGNVWEWTSDCWPGREAADCLREVRGGSWRTGPAALEISAARSAFPAAHRRNTIGFRVVLDLD